MGSKIPQNTLNNQGPKVKNHPTCTAPTLEAICMPVVTGLDGTYGAQTRGSLGKKYRSYGHYVDIPAMLCEVPKVPSFFAKHTCLFEVFVDYPVILRMNCIVPGSFLLPFRLAVNVPDTK